jgi:hypothetical protein
MQAVFAFLLVSGSAAQAQSSDTINVIGRKPEDVRREAQNFVRAVGVAEEPVARWIDPVCPEVLGVAPDIAARVVGRIRRIAKESGVRAAKPKCEGNLLVAFVQNGADVVKTVAKRSQNLFKDVSPQQREWLYAGAPPVRWWHATQTRTRDGMRDNGNDAPASGMARSDGPGGVPLAGDVHFQYRSSFASTQVVRAIRFATVIVDVDKSDGKGLDSVADMAALVGLAEVGPSEPPPSGSILSLFKPDGPRELTMLDTNFLRALYKLPLDRTALAHRGLLVKGLIAPVDK